MRIVGKTLRRAHRSYLPKSNSANSTEKNKPMTDYITIRIEKSVHDDLKKRVEVKGETFSDIIRRLLDKC